MNPLNPLLWKVLGVIAMIAVGIGLGYKATSAYYSPKVDALETKLKAANERADSFEQSYNAVAAAAQKQNDELTKLVAQANEREQQAKAAADKAKTESAGYQAQAASILQSQPPAGANECAAASAAFDAELKTERGKP
jgi:predicted  nucleic acid-binding Zn-ribbon protein